MRISQIAADANHYRSFTPSDLTARQYLDATAVFQFGRPLGSAWTPMRVEYYEEEGEEGKLIGDFPSIGGLIPFPISGRALEMLYPTIKDNVEVLDLIIDLDKFYALNVFVYDCLDHSRSIFTRF